MDIKPEMMILIAICASVLLILLLRGKAEWLLNVVMRSILGIVAIYFINEGLKHLGFPAFVGVNPITVLTSGILGFPGLMALYGIKIYQIL